MDKIWNRVGLPFRVQSKGAQRSSIELYQEEYNSEHRSRGIQEGTRRRRIGKDVIRGTIWHTIWITTILGGYNLR